MGNCHSTKNKINLPTFNSNLFHDTEIQRLDDMFKRCENLLIELEKIKIKYNRAWGKLLCETGAIVLKTPTLYSCCIGLLYQCARDMIGDDKEKSIRFENEYPFIEIEHTNDGDLSCVLITKESINNFGLLAKEIKKGEIVEEMKKMNEKIIKQRAHWFQEFKERSEGLKEMKLFVEKYYDNIQKITNGITFFNHLKAHIISSEKETVFQLNRLKDKNNLKRLFKKITEETNIHNDPKQFNNCNKMLYWNFTDENKHSNWEKVYKLWFQIASQEKKSKKTESEITLDDKKTECKKLTEKNLYSTKNSDVENEFTKQKIKKENSVTYTQMVYINNPIPLKGWNIKLNISLQLTDCYPTCFCYDNENQYLIVGTNTGKTIIFNSSNWETIDEIHSNESLNEVQYLNDGKTIISIDKLATVTKYNTSSKEERKFIVGESLSLSSAAYLLDGVTIIISSGRNLLAYDINTLEPILDKSTCFDCIIVKVLYIRQINNIVIGLENGNVILYNPLNCSTINEFTDHKERIIDISPIKYQGELSIASYSLDKTLNIYCLSKLKLLKSMKVTLKKTSLPANKLIYGYDEKTLITTHDDGLITFINYNTGDLEKDLVCKSYISDGEKITAAIYLGDGSCFIIGTEGKKIEVYNI